MKHYSAFRFLAVVMAAFALTLSAIAQQPETSSTKSKEMPAAPKAQVSSGQKQQVSGLVLRREGETLTVRGFDGKEYNVVVSDTTKIRERKSNPFRGAKKYSTSDLNRGLTVEVEGRARRLCVGGNVSRA